MLTQFNNIKNEIRHCEEEDDDNKGMKLCYELLNSLKKIRNKDTRDEYYFCYFMLAKMNKKLYGLYNLNFTLDFIKKSIKYSGSFGTNNYIRSQWLLAECYMLMNNEEKALTIYKICDNYYKNKNKVDKKNKIINGVNFEYRLLVLFNIGKVLKSTSALNLLIKTYKNQKFMEKATLEEMYIDLFNIYLHSNRYEAMQLLHTITDVEVVKKLRLKLLVAVA